MSELEGRWAILPSGRLVRIVGVDGDMVVAETPAGRTVDRPLPHVHAAWSLVDDDNLLVRASTDPDGLRAVVEAQPVDVVVSAIHDLGGEAETPAIQAHLERSVGPWVGTGDALKDWWRRVQPRVGDDPRIDDSRSLERRYRLLRPGEAKRQPLRDRVSDELRGGRRLAFAPSLKSARERARRRKPPLTEDELGELRAEAQLADLIELDATDRFMAGELEVWIGRRTAEEAAHTLGPDLLALDLLRIPQKASRQTALQWLDEWLRSQEDDRWLRPGDVPPTLASAVALGDDLGTAATVLAGQLGVRASDVIASALAWSHPGSEESRPWKLPHDYEPFLARVRRFEKLVATGEDETLIGLERGALRALKGLAGSPKHRSRADAVVVELAKVAVGARNHLDAASKAPAAVISELAPDRLEALLQVQHGGGGAWARTYLGAVELAFERDPSAYSGAVRLLGVLIGEDPGAIGARVVRRAVQRHRVVAMALAAAAVAETPEVKAECIALAATGDPDDQRSRAALSADADAVAAALLRGSIDVLGSVVFSPETWRRFAVQMERRLADAARNESEAHEAASAAEQRLAEVSASAEQMRDALAAVRTSNVTASRDSTARLAANVLKPVAAALSDSFEAPGLEALQDRLAAVLDRARIQPVMEPGEVQAFDPDVHRWVGEGNPSKSVTAVSPGFIAQLEGEHAIVLVPARVVAATED